MLAYYVVCELGNKKVFMEKVRGFQFRSVNKPTQECVFRQKSGAQGLAERIKQASGIFDNPQVKMIEVG